MKKRYIFQISVLFAASAMWACSGTTDLNPGLVSRLRNRGPVVLSSENPYLAANMFVAATVGKSPIISGFVKQEGVPSAIEIDQSLFAPRVLYFYYINEEQYYRLEESFGTWIIQGPNRIEGQMLVDLKESSKHLRGEPVLLEEQVSLQESTDSDSTQIWEDSKSGKTPPKNYLDELADEREDLYKRSFKSVAPRPVRENVPPKVKRLLKLQKSAQGQPAERSPNGDLVHHVTYPGESISALSLWYTHEQDNAGRIARINSIKNPDNLQLGDTVVIPAYLVKTGNRLTQEGLMEANSRE